VKKITLAVVLPALLILSVISFAQTNKATTQAEIKTVSKVDLKRYSGKWYEIARYPNKFQKNCVGNTTANYVINADNEIEVLNQCVKENGTMITAKGKAKIVDTDTNAKLKVRFAPGVLSFLSSDWGDYWIVDLDENYQYAAVGDPKREYLWILSRTPEMSDAVYQDILRRVEKMGFTPGKLTKTPQNVQVIKGAVIRKQ